MASPLSPMVWIAVPGGVAEVPENSPEAAQAPGYSYIKPDLPVVSLGAGNLDQAAVAQAVAAEKALAAKAAGVSNDPAAFETPVYAPDPADVRRSEQIAATGQDPLAGFYAAAGVRPPPTPGGPGGDQVGSSNKGDKNPKAGNKEAVTITDETGKRVFTSQAAADAFLQEKARAAAAFANAQQNVNARAMMKGLARDARMGLIPPEVAVMGAARIAGALDPNGAANVDSDGNPTAEFAASNPQAAKIMAEVALMRKQLGLGEKEIDVRKEIATDVNKTQVAITDKQESGATVRTGMATKAEVKKAKIYNRGETDRTQIRADAGKYGIDQDTAVRMREAGITERMNDNQFAYLKDKLGVDREALEKDHTVRMKVAENAREEFKERYATQLALGKLDHEAQMDANRILEEKYGQDFAVAGQEMALKSKQFDHMALMDKEQLADYRKNQAFENKFREQEQKFSERRVAIEEENAKIERQMAVIQTTTGSAEKLAALNMQKLKLSQELEQGKLAIEQGRQQLETGRIQNQSLETELKRKQADQMLFSKSEYPEVADRLNARTKWITENKDKFDLSGESVPPAIAGYLADLKAEGEDLFDQSWTSDSVEFREYAVRQLGAALGDDRVAAMLVNKFHPDRSLLGGPRWFGTED